MTFDARKLADVVMARCDQLALCSEDEDRITRRFLTPPMRDVHDRLGSWMRDANLELRVDNAGNLLGRRATVLSDRTLLLGSHLDSVPGAGRYDGVLGVLIGVAVAEALVDETLPFRLDVIGFSEEEGVRYSMPYLGSAAVAGTFEPSWLERTDYDGVSLRDAIIVFGLDPDGIADAEYSRDEVIAFIEPHLEQGSVLEQAERPIGVVQGIAGQSRLRLEFLGTAGHVGTTPMLGRSDALVMGAQAVGKVNALASEFAELRASVGQLSVSPNAPNVIPDRVELSLDVRHMDDIVREKAINEILESCEYIAKANSGSFTVLENNSKSAVLMDGSMSQVLASSVEACGHQPLELFSGAGHDAVVMAERFPTAMVFLRHPGGVSHHPEERVERDDVAVAIEVLCQFVRNLAAQHEPNQVSSS